MRTLAPSRRLAAAAVLASALSASSSALADGLALDRFDPAPAGDRMFGVQSPFAAGDRALHLMLLGDYARKPLVLRRDSDGEEVGSIVTNQLVMRLDGTFALWHRLTLNVDVPLVLAQGGDNPIAQGTTFTSPTGADFGDVRLGARWSFLGGYHDAFQMALAGYMWLPTGATGKFAGEGSLRGMPQLVLGGRTDRMVYSIAVGPHFRPSQTYGTVEQGTTLEVGAGLGFLLDDAKKLQVGPEISLGTVLADPTSRTTNMEGLLGVRYRLLDDVEAGLAAGPGLANGIGTPTTRLVFMVAYTPQQVAPPGDRDKDGIVDPQDACPDVPGLASADPARNGCPPPPDRDRDGIEDAKDACPDVPGVATDDPATNGCPADRDHDGIPDVTDACPDVPGVANADAAKNGCPPPGDTDKDGILDPDDACPDVPGVATSDPKTNGCPGDTDGDSIRDDKDACPNEKGKPSEDPTKNGCPQAVRVTAKEIVILQQVQFDTDKATIRKVSDALLDEVAGVMKEHPEITGIEVQGHTDSRGPRQHNVTLSQGRADSVKKALVARGVDAARLTAKGYGPDVSIADNATEEGRQKNRRVEFKITGKSDKQK